VNDADRPKPTRSRRRLFCATQPISSDRDPLFTQAWTQVLESSGVQSVPIPAGSPNGNPHAERFVRSVRSECLEPFVIFGERHLRYPLREFIEHYHTELNFYFTHAA
jgi:hypothetical protein